MKETVLKFIDRFQNDGTITAFTSGCCYWFAKTLEIRFDGEIVYNPVANHFATKIQNSVFDITGEIDGWSDFVGWKEYQLMEPLQSARIKKNCINF